MWLIYHNSPFILKTIFLKKNTRTSLQFHKEKEEANLIISGSAKLYYEDARNKKIKYTNLQKGHIILIKPNTLHRFEALTDLLMIEVSTPQVDYVIRVSDDYNRPSGLIISEHNT